MTGLSWASDADVLFRTRTKLALRSTQVTCQLQGYNSCHARVSNLRKCLYFKKCLYLAHDFRYGYDAVFSGR